MIRIPQRSSLLASRVHHPCASFGRRNVSSGDFFGDMRKRNMDRSEEVQEIRNSQSSPSAPSGSNAPANGSVGGDWDSKLRRSSGTEVLRSTLSGVGDYVKQQESRVDNRFFTYFEAGNTYAPSDLSLKHAEKVHSRQEDLLRPGLARDPFSLIKVDPLDCYTDGKFLSDFISNSGQIKSRESSHTSARNQRRLAKSIKRARAAGLLSYTSNWSAND